MDGILGFNNSEGNTIESCFNLGNIIGNSNVGAIFGNTGKSINLISCYYKKGTAENGYNGADYVTGEAIEVSGESPSVIDVIQNKITVDGQEINAWKEDTNNINNGYPILYWQE